MDKNNNGFNSSGCDAGASEGKLFQNPNRTDFYERYQRIISEYNQEQDRVTIEKTFVMLMNLANSMTQE